MFKKTLLALTLVSLSGAALSAPVANLKVVGTITPPTCTVNGGPEADVLYTFNVAPGMFPATGNLALASQVKNIEVICDATTYLSFDATDNKAGTELTAGNNNFGLGTYNTDTKVGFYTVMMKNAKVKADASASPVAAGIRLGSDSVGASVLLNKSYRTIWTLSSSNSSPASGQIFSADFEVTPTLNGVLKNSDGTAELDGHAVLAFAFGI